MKIFASFFIVILFCVSFPGFAPAQPKMSARILLVPLDDRPACLQFPVKMGLIGDAEIIAPPKELLGKFTAPGESDKIVKWLRTQDLKQFDAAIVSVDMLAYGGLVAMRTHQTDDETAMRRLRFVREMRRLAPQMKIYASSVIMRLAPTGDGKNEAYREKLSRWAEISVEADPKSKSETAKLEREIPAFALADYKAARVRDLKINRAAIGFVKDKIFDYLILSQDDAKPRGIHVADRERLIEEANRLNLTEKIAVQPGADEVSMLLLARAMTDKYDFHPKIKAIYSSEAAKNQTMPYEDRPLYKTVGFQIQSTGAVEVPAETGNFDTNISFFVFASRFEKDAAKRFADAVWKGKNVVVADVDPKGDLQGADAKFVEFLINLDALSDADKKKASSGFAAFLIFSGYASWNTAGNTIGTALPQGILSGLANDNYFDVGVFRKNKKNGGKANEKEKADFLRRTAKAHEWFIIHRLIDDYAYHSLVRPKALQMIKENKWNAFRLTDEQTKTVEDYCLKQLQPTIEEFARDYKNFTKGKCEMSPVTFDLPWNRTFEAEIDFNLECGAAKN
jgi:hypothetical protein